MAHERWSALRAAISPLQGAPFPWAVAGGWALDLAAGEVTRPHGDVEVSLFYEDLPAALLHLRGWRALFAVPGAGRLAQLRAPADAAPPIHELHLARGDAHLEVLLEEREGDHVIFRRDRRIRLPAADVAVHSTQGVPCVAPHWQLLYKAKDPRPKDDLDFAAHAPRLGAEERRFLKEALALHLPGCAWHKQL